MDDEDAEMEEVRLRLEHDFRAALPVPLIDLVWEEEQERLAPSVHHQLDPVEAERAARVRLRGLSGAARLPR